MLHEFLKANRTELIARCRAKAAKRMPPDDEPPMYENGIPQFLTQLINAFRLEQTPEALERHAAGGSGRPSLALVPLDIATTAAKHGEEMRRQGVLIGQVVHGYGDLCQSLTELALEKGAPITVDEFHTFNRCLDDAIADAVTSYSSQEAPASSAQAPAPSEGLGSPAQEMFSLVERAIHSFAAIKAGEVGLKGTTSVLHETSLVALRNLIGRTTGGDRGNSQPVSRPGAAPGQRALVGGKPSP